MTPGALAGQHQYLGNCEKDAAFHSFGGSAVSSGANESPSVQSSVCRVASRDAGQSGTVLPMASSAREGKRSRCSTNACADPPQAGLRRRRAAVRLTVVRPTMGFWPKTVGSFTMNGMRVADSKFVI